MIDILHIIIRKITCIIFLLFSFYVFNASASNDVISIKYGYGKNPLGNINPYYNPIAYPLNESAAYKELQKKNPEATIRQLYPYYSSSDAENEAEKSKRNINVTLYVWQSKNNIYARVKFHNKSKYDYFVHNDYLPTYGELCGSAFLITTGSIKLDYLGMHCQFQGASLTYDARSDRTRLKAGEKHSFLITLNREYEFLPGMHQYNIGSLGYSLVNEDWFVEYSIYTKMFSILDQKPTCPIVTNLPLMTEKRWLCPHYNSSTNNLKYILRKYGIDGGARKGSFEIRTNQVVIMINGNDDVSHIKKLRLYRPR